MARLSKDKRDKLILVAVGTIAVVAGLWHGVMKRRTEQLALTDSRLGKAVEKLERAKKMVARAAQAEAEVEAATRKLKAIEETMACGVDLYSWSWSFLREKAIPGHAVNVIDVTRPGKGEVRLLPEFPYEAATFTLKGNVFYHDFGKFLADIENHFPYFRV